VPSIFLTGSYNLKNFLLHFFIVFLFSMQSLDGISDIRDESDRSGMRVVIEVKYINKPWS
jgi:DNA gyrase/topoisomerase IV subunit A